MQSWRLLYLMIFQEVKDKYDSLHNKQFVLHNRLFFSLSVTPALQRSLEYVAIVAGMFSWRSGADHNFVQICHGELPSNGGKNNVHCILQRNLSRALRNPKGMWIDLYSP